MFVSVCKGALGLLAACWLSPSLHAFPPPTQVIVEEGDCLNLTGYGGQSPKTARPSRMPKSDLAVGICAVDNARGNTALPLKTNSDYVPVTGDDSMGFYCVYGVRASSTGGVGGNVCIYIFELDNNEVLIFGSGYGNIPGANLFDAAYDMARVDQVIRFCMGKNPATTPLRLVAPHGHGDHINPACNRELERLGYTILEIAFHPGDLAMISGMAWTTADRNLFHVLPTTPQCLGEILSYTSPIGKLWFFERPGHTPGSIDMVVDIKNDPTNRFLVRGSQASTLCMPLSGMREGSHAHGNVELLAIPPTLTDVTPLAGTSLGGTPLTLTGVNFTAAGAGTHVVLVNGAPATEVVVVNDTTLTCKTPPGPPAQLVEVAVVNNNGKSTYPGSFFYNEQPSLTSISPTSGDWRGNTLVQVRGSGYALASGVNDVYFGTKKATAVTIIGDGLITCRTPSGTAATLVDVEVRNPNGQSKLVGAFRYNSDLSITSVTPADGTALGGTAVVLTGTALNGNGGTPTVTFGGVPATSVVLISSTSVSCVTPAGVPGASVTVTLTNTAGTISFPGYRYHATPLATSISPGTGTALGGTLVTLTGSGFSIDNPGTTQVRFSGALATSVTVLSNTALTCRTPSGPAGTLVNLTVTNLNGTATLPLAFTYAQPLTAKSVLPPSGSSMGGTPVTITGSGFVDGPAGTTSVRFGGVLATAVSALDDRTLSCIAPAGTPGAQVDVTLTNNNGSTTVPLAYRYNEMPALAAVTPNHGHAGAVTTATLTGTGFLDDDAGFDLIVVGGTAATDVDVINDTTLTCDFPPGTPGATVDVLLVNQNGTASLNGAFRYHASPTLTAATPSTGSATSRLSVTLTGAGFLNDQAGTPTVTFGGLAATNATVLSDTSLRCNAPVGTPGQQVAITVSNARGSATLSNGFRYFARPTLTLLSPVRGTPLGNTSVTLTGTGFQANTAGTNTVTFGGVPATAVVVLGDNSLQCKTPPGVSNTTVDVVVSNTNGTATLVRGFSYSVPAPTLTALTPSSGPAQSPGSIQLTGSGFLDDSAGTNTVLFGGVPSGIVGVIDDRTLTCQVPPGAPGTRVDVSLSNANGSTLLAQAFRYNARPALTAISPDGASSVGGATVQLTGSGFQVDAAGPNSVTFGGVPASNVTLLGDTALTCVVPAATPGTTVDVVVTNVNGQSAPRAFPIFPTPSLWTADPAFGPATGNTAITLTGRGFLDHSAGINAVLVGGKAARNVVVVSDTQLTCLTPRGTAGFSDISLTNANGWCELPDGFHYGKLPPAILSVDPASSPSTGQNLVTVKGRGFLAGGTNRVKFGATQSTNVFTVDDETLVCAAPPGVPGQTVDVGLNNTMGTVTLAQAYRYHALPTVVTANPPQGDPLGTTRVRVTGSGFLVDQAGENVVLFGNVRARNVRVVDDQHLTCTPAGGTPGALLDITVRNANGSVQLPQSYRLTGGAPSVSDVQPRSGTYLGGTNVTILGSGFQAPSPVVLFGKAQATGVVVIDDSRLTCVTPPGNVRETVSVSVQTVNGIGAMLGAFTYQPPLPDVVSVAPDHGSAQGGTRVSVTGKNFQAPGAGASIVTFDGVAAGNVTIASDTSLSCDAPAGPAGTRVALTLQNANGSDTLPNAFRYHALPTLTAIAPARGPAAGGTQVTLSGSGFSADNAAPDQVLFGGVAALSVSVVNDTTLTCTTPAGSAGATVDVRLSNRNGAATLPAAFHYHVVPVITSVTPARGPAAGGTALTLSGSGFVADAAGPNLVTIGNGAGLGIVTVSDTTITCTAPPGSAGPALDVRVVNANGSATAPGAFAYFTPPTLTAVAPARGPVAGGTAVTLTGAGFLATGAGDNLVLFGGSAALDVIELSDTTLTCTTPPGTPGATVDVTLANANGIVALVGAFRYHGVTTLTSLTPNRGPAVGNTLVTLGGSGFLADDAGTNTVLFGTIPATNVVAASDTTLLCRAPAGTAGQTVSVSVSNANGSANLPAAYRYHAQPTLTNVSPSRGPASGGTTVTLTGTGFLVDDPGTNRVLFGAFAATAVTVLSNTSLTCIAPTGTPTALVNVTLGNNNGSATSSNAYRFNALPTLTSVTPGSGSSLGGTLVTLSGSGFALNSPGTNAVLFGATPATAVTVQNDTTLTCLAPAGAGGVTVGVIVSNANGSANLPAAYRFNAVPTLASLAPTHGTALGGTSVTLTGTGFAAPQAGVPLVTFGGTAATSILVLDDTRVSCLVPPGAGGAVVDVRVSNANGQATLVGGYRYHARPTLAGVNPARGSSVAPSAVILTGSGFLLDGAGTNSVLFGAVAATSVVALDDATLTCLVAPASAGSVVDVTVSNANGAAVRVAGFAFDAPAPLLTGVSPGTGPFPGGTGVALSGSGFLNFSAGSNAVTFGGNAATGVVVLSDTSLTCSTPAGTLGATVDVRVTNNNGTTLLPAAFGYVAPAPTLLAVSPASGPSAGGAFVTLTGTGFLANGAGANTVRFGTTPSGAVSVLDDATLSCQVPPGTAGSVTVEVANANGTVQLAAGYRYHAAPTIASIAPAHGTSLGGTLVTVLGTGFLNDSPGPNAVRLGNTSAGAVVVFDNTRLTCRVPSGLAGSIVNLSVTNANGSATLTNSYRYHSAPTIAAVTPANGPALGGNKITISGTGFTADGAVVNIVTLGGISATGVSVLSDTALQCTVPQGTGGLSVQVNVANVNGTAQLANGYRYNQKPTVTAAVPGTGPVLGGTTVTLSGSGFQVDSPGTSSVLFGTSAATLVSVLDDATLTCVTPAGSAGALVDIQVANANGSGTLFGGFTYDSVVVPIVTTLAPTLGSTQGSTQVTIKGAGFTTGMTVDFGGSPALDVTMVDDQTLTCTTPARATNDWVDVAVHAPDGDANLPLCFKYVQSPALSAVEPPNGDPSGGALVVLTGAGFLEEGAGEPQVLFSATPATNVAVLDDQHLRCEAPAGSALTQADVRVTNAHGSALLAPGFRWQRKLASDLDSDGRGDLVLSAPGDDAFAANAGAVHVFYGTALPLLDRSSNQSDLTALPERVAASFGLPVASGDLDGDGHAELLVAAPGDDLRSRDAGSVYIFSGPLPPSAAPLLPSQAATVLFSSRSSDRFGSALFLRDVDRNGVLDLLVGVPGRTPGAAHLFLGGPGGLATQPARVLIGEFGNEGFANTLAVGDLDGDGWPDLVVGAPSAFGDLALSPTGSAWNPGEVRVFRGGPGPFPATERTPWLVFSGDEEAARFGSSLAVADISGDGIEDLIVGSPQNSGTGSLSGAIHVFLGGSGITGVRASAAQVVLSAEGAGNRFGSSLSAGDIDGDGFPDLLVGAPGYANTGRAYLFRGSSALTSRSAAAADVLLQAEPGSPGEFGSSVALVNVDGDAFEDMVVTAPGLDGAETDLGRVYVFQGNTVLAPRTAQTNEGTVTGFRQGDQLGKAMTGDH